MENVDIVDLNNQVLVQTSKQEAHEKGLLHRTVIAEVKDKKGNWILVKQSSSRQDAGQFVSPVGGHVTAGETEIDALKREAHEELGIKDFTFKYIGKAIFNREILNRKENHYFIIYEIYSDNKIKLNHESDSYQKFSVSELKQRLIKNPEIFGAAFHFIIEKFYGNLLS
jgi:isopentenyl-diphosphate Delta-isomerase